MFGEKYNPKKTIEGVRRSLAESEHKALSHEDEAELHRAHADMYRNRSERLRETLAELEARYADALVASRYPWQRAANVNPPAPPRGHVPPKPLYPPMPPVAPPKLHPPAPASDLIRPGTTDDDIKAFTQQHPKGRAPDIPDPCISV